MRLSPESVSPSQTGNRILYYYVDHTILCPTNTGVQRVTRCLGRALLTQGERVLFVKWDMHYQQLVLLNKAECAALFQWHGYSLPKENLEDYPSPQALSRSQAPLFPVGKHLIGEGCWLIVPEVTHMTYHPRPVTLEVIMAAKNCGLKTAFVFYDAIPLRRLELSTTARLHETYMQQLLLADIVVPISDWSARDLVSFFCIHENVMRTSIPHVATIALPGESQWGQRVTVPVSFGGTKKIILSVGSIEPRKNQLVLVHAFENFCANSPDKDWELALVGNLHRDVAHEMRLAIKRNSRVRFLAHIPDDELTVLYRSCAFTVFPSIEEGFGLPIIESLWYAKPCICANFGAMWEVAEGGGCLTVNVREKEEIVRALTRMTTDPSLLERLSHEATNRLIATWADYAKQFIERIHSEEQTPSTNLLVDPMDKSFFYGQFVNLRPH